MSSVEVFTDPKCYAQRLKRHFPLCTPNAKILADTKAQYPHAPKSFWENVSLELNRFDAGHDAPEGC